MRNQVSLSVASVIQTVCVDGVVGPKGRPMASQPPAQVAINPVTEQQAMDEECTSSLNMPTLAYARQKLEDVH